jgi:hypothetical protein
VPAAAVIPAPIAYTKVVAVKKPVVEFWAGWEVSLAGSTDCWALLFGDWCAFDWVGRDPDCLL